MSREEEEDEEVGVFGGVAVIFFLLKLMMTIHFNNLLCKQLMLLWIQRFDVRNISWVRFHFLSFQVDIYRVGIE